MVLFGQLEHGFLHDVEGCGLVPHRVDGVFERAALNLCQEIGQRLLGSQGGVPPVNVADGNKGSLLLLANPHPEKRASWMPNLDQTRHNL
jgi:hypothetical protein